MKLLLCTLFSCFLITLCFAQKEETFTISLDNNESSEKAAVPFSVLQVVDARFDKTNVGCVVKDFSFKGMTKNKLAAIFPDSLHTYLPRMLEKFARPNKSSSDTMLMLVKQFRIADHLFNTLDTYHAPETVLTISASFYKKSNGRLLKFFSVNDTWSKEWSALEDDDSKKTMMRRNDAIVELLFKIFQNRDWTPTPTSFSWTDMEIGLQKRFQLPLFQDEVLNIGLYKTFDEFKNNQPSFTHVHFKQKNSDYVQVLDETDTPVNIKEFWGVCDGQNRYIAFRGAFHKLNPNDKSFRFLSNREESKNRHMLATTTTRLLLFGTQNGQTVNQGPGVRVKKEYFYLNMDNGQIYLEELIGTENYERAVRALNNTIY